MAPYEPHPHPGLPLEGEGKEVVAVLALKGERNSL